MEIENRNNPIIIGALGMIKKYVDRYIKTVGIVVRLIIIWCSYGNHK